MKKFFLLIITALMFAENLYAQGSLKILFMLNCFPALSATFVMGQITGLIDRGHEVSIFAYRKSAEKKSDPNIKSYKLLERTYFKNLPQDISSYDILYCQFFSTAKRFLPKLIRLKKSVNSIPKVIVCCRGGDGIEHIDDKDKDAQMLFSQVDLFLPVCEHFKNYLLNAGCDANKIFVHHSAIDLNKFHYKDPNETLPDKEIVLLSVGRLAETKGHAYAIHAFAKLERKFPQLRYVIIGDGSLRTKLETIIRNYNLTEKISLLGWRTHDEIIQWLHKAHIFVHPAVKSAKGYEEGIPNVLMEALASGIPVVCTATGGTQELVRDTISGLIVPERDVEGLIKKIKFFIEHPEYGKKISIMGRMLVEQQHDIEKENDSLEKILYSI